MKQRAEYMKMNTIERGIQCRFKFSYMIRIINVLTKILLNSLENMYLYVFFFLHDLIKRNIKIFLIF